MLWTIAAGWESIQADLVAAIERGLPDSALVKQGQHRSVHRLEIAGQSFFVKRYPCRGLRGQLRRLVRTSTARREWEKIQEVARRGIATVAPVAWGEERRWGFAGESCLVTAALAEARPLDQYLELDLRALPADEQIAARRRLVESLAVFVADLHRAGIDHNDFHAGNVLLQWTKDAPPRLNLIDLPGVKLGGPLSWRRSRDSLAMFTSSLWAHSSLRERWSFWKIYLGQREDLAIDRRSAARELFSFARAHARWNLRRRDNRAMRTNRDFQRLAAPAATAHVLRGVPAEFLSRLGADPDEPIRRFRHVPVKLSHAAVTVIAEIPAAGDGKIPVAYKRSRPTGWWKAQWGRFRRPRAVENWRRGHALLARGIATPRPLFALVSRQAARLGDSHLAVEWIADAENLHLFGWRLAGLAAGQRIRPVRQAAAALGSLVGRMHDERISHRDLKGTNLLFVDRRNEVAALVVDLDGVRIQRRLGLREQIDNLARIAVSLQMHPLVTRADRLRFLRSYLAAMPEADQNWKTLWRWIESRERRLLRRKQRIGRPVA